MSSLGPASAARYPRTAALLTAVVTGIAACGGDGGGSSPATPSAPAPAPAPTLRLAFADVPREPVMVNVGESQTLRVGISPAVVARCAATAADADKVQVTSDSSLCEGSFQFTLTGLETGETAVRLAAEAAGYRDAAASLDAVVLRGAEVRTRRDLEFTFRHSSDLADYVELRILQQEGEIPRGEFEDSVIDLLRGIHVNDWGWFEHEDAIAWDETTERTVLVVLADTAPYVVPMIQVWGLPFFNEDRRFEDREAWWVIKQFTSFGRGGQNIDH